MNCLDHIVVAADNLQQGVDYLQATLGIEIPAGGRHSSMATHNLVMQLGNDAYIEVIAIDPDARAPRHPRWFSLDSADMRAAIREQPRLITWVMNTPDLQSLAGQAGFDIGEPTSLSRDKLSWEFALPDDGRLLGDGMLPYCIQWHSSPHPAQSMVDLDCVLQDLTIHHIRPRWLNDRLEALGASHLVNIEQLPDTQPAYLSATIDTPNGRVVLRS